MMAVNTINEETIPSSRGIVFVPGKVRNDPKKVAMRKQAHTKIPTTRIKRIVSNAVNFIEVQICMDLHSKKYYIQLYYPHLSKNNKNLIF